MNARDLCYHNLNEALGGRLLTARDRRVSTINEKIFCRAAFPPPERALILCLLGEDGSDPMEDDQIIRLLGGAWVRVLSTDTPRVKFHQQRLERDDLPGTVIYAQPVRLDMVVA